MSRQVTLVVGPPLAGKSTWVAERARPGDTVVDWDALAVEAGSPRDHDHEREYRAAASRMRTQLEQHIADIQFDGVAWVIRTLPFPEDRPEVVARLGATDVVVLDPGMDVCLERAREAGRHPDIDAVIVKWYALKAGARCYVRTPRGGQPRARDPRSTEVWKAARRQVLKTATTCAICGGRLRFDLRKPHPKSPSVDHIIPIALGGAPYDAANLQAVHYGCNAAKQDSNLSPRHRTSDDY